MSCEWCVSRSMTCFYLAASAVQAPIYMNKHNGRVPWHMCNTGIRPNKSKKKNWNKKNLARGRCTPAEKGRAVPQRLHSFRRAKFMLLHLRGFESEFSCRFSFRLQHEAACAALRLRAGALSALVHAMPTYSALAHGMGTYPSLGHGQSPSAN